VAFSKSMALMWLTLRAGQSFQDLIFVLHWMGKMLYPYWFYTYSFVPPALEFNVIQLHVELVVML
jgi:hypothetical protein